MYKDPFTGRYHTHYRDFDPITNRWNMEDPAGYADGLNLYASYMGVNGRDVLGDAVLSHDQYTFLLQALGKRIRDNSDFEKSGKATDTWIHGYVLRSRVPFRDSYLDDRVFLKLHSALNLGETLSKVHKDASARVASNSKDDFGLFLVQYYPV